MAASNPLPLLLGGMLIDSIFRAKMLDDIDDCLDSYGITLTPYQREVTGRMVASFQSGGIEPAIQNIAIGCPNWPCNDFTMLPSRST